MHLVNGYRYEYDDFGVERLGWRLKRKSVAPLLQWTTLAAGCALLAAGIVVPRWLGGGAGTSGLALAVVGIFAALVGRALIRMRGHLVGSRGDWEKHFLNRGAVAIWLDEEGLNSSSVYVDLLIRYGAMDVAVESPTTFSIWGDNGMVVIPKRAMSEETIGHARTVFQERAKRYVEVGGRKVQVVTA